MPLSSPFVPRPATPEHMDDPQADPAEIAHAFRFIERVNRRLGGISSIRDVFQSTAIVWPRGRPLRWIDLGTGSADIPIAIDRWAHEAHRELRCVAIDNHPACLAVAARALAGHPRIELRTGDAHHLNAVISDGPYDLIHAGMFLHHLTDDAVVAVLRAMGQAADVVVWNDLLRSTWSRVAIRALTIGRSAMVRDDARLSVAKGFTAGEATALANRAGLRVLTLRRRTLLGRFALVARSAAEQPLATDP